MKQIIMMLVGIMVSSLAFAQEPVISAPPPILAADSVAKNITVPPPSGNFLCAHCGLRMEGPGKCSVHNFILVEKGHYYCPNCDSVRSENPGKCSKCQTELIMMDLRKE